jgi:hypothetical protein
MRDRYSKLTAETLSAALRGSRAVFTEDMIDLSHSCHIPTKAAVHVSPLKFLEFEQLLVVHLDHSLKFAIEHRSTAAARIEGGRDTNVVTLFVPIQKTKGQPLG